MSQIKIKLLDFSASEFPAQKLPSIGDVIKAFCFERENLKISKEAAIKIVVDKLCAIWKTSMIPTVSYKTIGRRVSTCIAQYLTLAKSKSSSDINHKKVDSLKVFVFSYQWQNEIFIFLLLYLAYFSQTLRHCILQLCEFEKMRLC